MPTSRNDADHLIALVGARAKLLRAIAGHTQEEMAARTGCTLRNYQRLESGHVNLSLRSVARLAAALGVHPGELFVPEARAAGPKAAPRDVKVERLEPNIRRHRGPK